MANEGTEEVGQVFKVTRDRDEKFRGTNNECWIYIQKHQAMSVDWAMKYEGWAIVPVDEGN